MEVRIQNYVPLSLMTMRAKGNTADSGWFSRFEERTCFHNVKVSDEQAPSAGVKIAKKLP
jgi:hypothetical protein